MAAERFHSLDAARGAAMMLGLFFHGAISFMATPIGWAIQDRSRSEGVDVFVWFCHTFRMPVFFLMSGFFARLLYLKLGRKEFIRHRAKRILLPFIIALVPLMPAFFGLWHWGAAKGGVSPPHPLGLEVPRVDEWRLRPSPGHLWFLYYLMFLMAGAALIAPLGRWTGNLLRHCDGLMRAAVRLRLLPFVMAVPTALTLLPMKGLEAETPVDFVPQVRILAFYAVFFATGWFFHRQTDLIPIFGKRLWIPLLLCLLILAPLGVLLDLLRRTGTLGSAEARMGGLLLSALFSWAMVMLFLGMFVRWLSRPRPWVAYLSDASYWCYLLHLPVAVFVQIVVSDWTWPGPLKFALVMAGTLAVCLGSYHFMVRYTLIGTALNGKRVREPSVLTPHSSVSLPP